MSHPDVLIVGGGVVGSSIAWHLSARGMRVRVLDRSVAPASGATGRATGGFRAQFGSRTNVQLSLFSREKLLVFADETGVEPGYQPVGYLYAARSEATLGALLRAMSVQHASGLVGSRSVSVAEIATLNPALATGDLVGGTFSPTDGFIRPLQLLMGYRLAALRKGARFDDGARCTAIERDGDRVTGVRVTSASGAEERIACGTVIDAAGPWATEIAAMAGIDIPVATARSHVAVTVPTNAVARDAPMTIVADDGFHFRHRDGRVLLLLPSREQVAGVDPTEEPIDDGWLSDVMRVADHRVPALRGVAIDRAGCWSGVAERTPDDHLLFGESGACRGFLLAAGSGKGVMHAPAIGALMAELLCDGRATTVDVTPLHPDRFAHASSTLPFESD